MCFLLLAIVARYLFDWITPFTLRDVSAQKNAAVGRVLRGLYLGLAIILAAAMYSTYSILTTLRGWRQGCGPLLWMRLPCHRFRANEVRLLLGVIAYNLGNLLRRLALPVTIQSWSLTSLQQRLFKTGERLVRHARHFGLQLAGSHLTQRLFGKILGGIERLAWHPT